MLWNCRVCFLVVVTRQIHVESDFQNGTLFETPVIKTMLTQVCHLSESQGIQNIGFPVFCACPHQRINPSRAPQNLLRLRLNHLHLTFLHCHLLVASTSTVHRLPHLPPAAFGLARPPEVAGEGASGVVPPWRGGTVVGRRVWDSYKTMQDYQRSRRMHNNQFQTFNDFQNRHMQGRQHVLARPYPDPAMEYTDPARAWQQEPNSRLADLDPYPAYNRNLPSFPLLPTPHQRNSNLPPGPFPPGGNFNLPPEIAGLPPAQMMSDVVRRTAFSMAQNMLSFMINGPGMPRPHFNGMPNPDMSFPQPFLNGDSPAHHSTPPPRRHHTTRPFPCHFRRAGQAKRSWGEVREAVHGGGGRSDEEVTVQEGEVEVVQPEPEEVLWGPGGINPLVRAGTKHGKADVLTSLRLTQMADLSKRGFNDRCFEESSVLEIAFDVYLPGSNYKKTNPTIPKHRIIVVRSTDPITKFAELSLIQRKWNDGASLQIAFVDFGEISFVSFNSVSLPSLVPHE